MKSINTSAVPYMDRGSFDMSFRQDNEVCAAKWFDNKAVLLGFQKLRVERHNKYKRWSEKNSKTYNCEGVKR